MTTIVVSLIQILKEGLPSDFTKELNEEWKQFLWALIKILLRVIDLLSPEDIDFRSFDVLIEMHKLFKKHPAESLKEDLLSLEEFDYVYWSLKIVSDKMIEI